MSSTLLAELQQFVILQGLFLLARLFPNTKKHTRLDVADLLSVPQSQFISCIQINHSAYFFSTFFTIQPFISIKTPPAKLAEILHRILQNPSQ